MCRGVLATVSARDAGVVVCDGGDGGAGAVSVDAVRAVKEDW